MIGMIEYAELKKWADDEDTTPAELLAKITELIEETEIPEADVIEICNEFGYVPNHIELVATGNTKNEAYAEFALDETAWEVPEYIQNFIDYGALGEDIVITRECNGDVVYVFLGEPGNYRLYCAS